MGTLTRWANFLVIVLFLKKKKKKEEESSGVGEESEDVDEPRLVTSPELPKLGW